MATGETELRQPEPVRKVKKKKKKKKGPFKVHRYGGWLLYFWHGMRLGVWFGLLGRNRFKVTLNCLPNILSVTVFAPVNSMLYALSELLYRRRAEAYRFEQPPIFVVGHWRTGTTHLHNLLACDRRFAYPNLYQVLYPHVFLSTEATTSRLLSIFLPDTRFGLDNVRVSFTVPYEDEFALAATGRSVFWVGLGRVYRPTTTDT